MFFVLWLLGAKPPSSVVWSQTTWRYQQTHKAKLCMKHVSLASPSVLPSASWDLWCGLCVSPAEACRPAGDHPHQEGRFPNPDPVLLLHGEVRMINTQGPHPQSLHSFRVTGFMLIMLQRWEQNLNFRFHRYGVLLTVRTLEDSDRDQTLALLDTVQAEEGHYQLGLTKVTLRLDVSFLCRTGC